jgi:ABC-type glycerol-3-phosphate transport system substrate-binding protein
MRKVAMGMLIGGMMLVAAAACSTAPSATSGAPPATNITGTWNGTYVFEPSSAGNGTVTVNWTQSGSQLKGTLDIQGPHRSRAFVINGIMS